MTKPSIYLDYAATTPMSEEVLETMRPYFVENFYNPSANYLAAKAVKSALSEARAAVARCLGTKPAEIIFTAGATEANNLAIQGVMRGFPDGEVLVSAVEHDSVLTPAWLFDCREIPVDKEGLVDPQRLRKMVTDKTVLVSIGMVNNEIGTLQPLAEISKELEKIRKERQKRDVDQPLYLHTDAAQAGNYFDLNTSRLGVDMMSLNGGKIYGPKQSGVLFYKPHVKIAPIIGGGGQEWGMRAGTENVPAIIGLSRALDRAQAGRQRENRRLGVLKKVFIEKVLDTIAGAAVNGSKKNSAPHIISVTIPGMDNERMMMQLDEAGIQCATGSACHASKGIPSHVLMAIGLSEDLARATLRFSLGRRTTQKDVSKAVAELAKIAASNR